MFNMIWYPLAALCFISALLGMKMFAIILAPLLAVALAVYLLLNLMEKHGTVTPLDQEVITKPMTYNQWLVGFGLHLAVVIGLLLVILAA